MKRHFVRILTALLLLALLPGLFTPARAAVSGECGDNLTWELDSATGTLTISGTGAMEDYVVPWDQYKTSIRSVIIEEGVRNIGAFAFYRCTAVQEVQIPSSVTVIGEYAFAQCGALESIEIPEGVTEIQYETFSQCDGLKTVTLPQSLKTIGDGAFSYCNALETIEIPEGVTEIRYGAFSQCGGLKSVTLPQSLETIGHTAFYNCDALETVSLCDDLQEIGDEAFAGCDNLKDIRIPWGTKIGRGAFDGCTKMNGYLLWRLWNVSRKGFWSGLIMLAAVAAAVNIVVWLVFRIRTRRKEHRDAG